MIDKTNDTVTTMPATFDDLKRHAPAHGALMGLVQRHAGGIAQSRQMGWGWDVVAEAFSGETGRPTTGKALRQAWSRYLAKAISRDIERYRDTEQVTPDDITRQAATNDDRLSTVEATPRDIARPEPLEMPDSSEVDLSAWNALGIGDEELKDLVLGEGETIELAKARIAAAPSAYRPEKSVRQWDKLWRELITNPECRRRIAEEFIGGTFFQAP